ncbi:GH15484 [Drosophila grimshawi]|uniref:GH15484 n=1 Tax=Drosophila grimshawi TaxID=7222 RepID=B4J233_DROGR|nr:GH15484 [Drosophila grimshawi]
MGNRITHRSSAGVGVVESGSQFNTRRRYQQHKRDYCLQDDYRSKTLPARCHQQPNDSVDSQQSAPLGSSSCLGTSGSSPPNGGETSRMLFLLYLIHRTWNVVMDTMDTRTKSRSTPQKVSNVEMEQRQRRLDEECSIGITDLDASSYCSQYSCCSCSYCYEEAVDNRTNACSSNADEYSVDSIYERAKSITDR